MITAFKSWIPWERSLRFKYSATVAPGQNFYRFGALGIFNRKAQKAGAGVAHPPHDVQQIFQRARKPVELPNHQHVPFPELLQGLVKFWPVPAATGGLLFENPFAADLAQRFNLDRVSWASAFETRASRT